MERMETLLAAVRACTVCASSLPAGPRPIVQASTDVPIVSIGQAPGRRVHESGVPWDDPSGVRLREWLGSRVSNSTIRRSWRLSRWDFAIPARPSLVTTLRALFRRGPLLDADRDGRTVARVLASAGCAAAPVTAQPHWLTKNPRFEAEAVAAIQARVREVVR